MAGTGEAARAQAPMSGMSTTLLQSPKKKPRTGRQVERRARESRRRRGAKTATRWSYASSWSAIGAGLGYFIALCLPANVVSPHAFSAALGSILGGLAALSWLSRFWADRTRDLSSCLRDVERLFLDGQINEDKWARLRNTCVDRFR